MNEIEKMAAIIEADYKEWLDITGCLPNYSSYYYECLGAAKDGAEKLHNAGYGDVKQAVREFAEILKENCTFDGHRVALDKNRIDELVKEVYGE